ncbi:hypothetical protein [Sphingomonas cavernae]|uniref:hypothetical protein n=1 Tax=Sphingomonas cavernae TaxID=2320861 RepID=UPI0015FF42E4|nr:hypothetical protein [Sphingomonas cavernae]
MAQRFADADLGLDTPPPQCAFGKTGTVISTCAIWGCPFQHDLRVFGGGRRGFPRWMRLLGLARLAMTAAAVSRQEGDSVRTASRKRSCPSAVFTTCFAWALTGAVSSAFAQETPPPDKQDFPPTSVAAGQASAPTPGPDTQAMPAATPASQVQGPPAGAEAPTQPHKKKFFDRFFDEEDGKFDFSNILAKGGFLPVPIIITEPAVDGGFGLAATFITVPRDHPKRMTRRVVGAMKTGNGSYGYGYFQSGTAFDGRMSYKFGVGRGKVTLDTFPAFAPQGIEYSSKYDYGILGSALWHLGDERFSIGPLIDFRKLSTKLDIAGLPDDFADHFNNTLHTGALGLGFHFDDRDNPLTPTKGSNAYIEGKFNRTAFGSDRNYEVYDVEAYTFDKISPKLRIGLKLELDAIRGDFPIFYAPAIDIRGVQAMEYQGMNVLNTEVEVTWQLSPRWSLLAFGGMGATDAGSSRIYADSGTIFGGGAGFRYRIARKLGLDAGIDVAYGPGGATFYIQFGHAWSFGMD